MEANKIILEEACAAGNLHSTLSSLRYLFFCQGHDDSVEFNFESYIPATQEQKTSTLVPVLKKMKKQPIQAMPIIFEDENSNTNITDQPKPLSKVFTFHYN
jgi:hypothetical protein